MISPAFASNNKAPSKLILSISLLILSLRSSCSDISFFLSSSFVHSPSFFKKAAFAFYYWSFFAVMLATISFLIHSSSSLIISSSFLFLWSNSFNSLSHSEFWFSHSLSSSENVPCSDFYLIKPAHVLSSAFFTISSSTGSSSLSLRPSRALSCSDRFFKDLDTVFYVSSNFLVLSLSSFASFSIFHFWS